MIQITDETIKTIAEDLLENYVEQYDDEPPITLAQTCEAVENWLLRTINEIEINPAFYAPGTMQLMNSRVPEFREPHRLQCIHFGWSACQNRPEPHQIYCAEHLEMIREAEAEFDLEELE